MKKNGALQINGYEFFYENHGDPDLPAVLFASGAMWNMKYFQRFIPSFKNKAHIILVDLPGMGKAPLLSAAYDFEFLADSIKFLLDNINIQKVHLIGASYSTPYSYLFAAKYPEYINKLILSGMAGNIGYSLLEILREHYHALKNNPESASVISKSISFFLNEQQTGIPNHEFVKMGLIETLLQIKSNDLDKFYQNSIRSLLYQDQHLTYGKKPIAPTLIFTGEYDPITPPQECQAVAKMLPQAYFTTIANADHFVALEQPEAYMNLINHFLFDPNDFHEKDKCTESE